jgi:chemotaxis protein histidine kinase CheA
VRELSRALSRRARLEIQGADTELDKVLVEQLDDPLVHLLRNALDHGLEPEAQRVAAGKPPEGLIRLSAHHRGSQIVITIADDGRGIDAAAVRRRAVERGLLSAEEAALHDDRRALELILRPGFSTAEQISEVSGRGVGLDVVARAVRRMKGSIEIQTEPGKGTTFVLRLPLTLAIIQVLTIQVADEIYAVPLELVGRALSAPSGAVRRVYDREVLLLAEDGAEQEVVLIDLRHVLGAPPAAAPDGERQVILVEVAGAAYGLVCDRQLGKREIVVKSLGELIDRVPCVAGATLIDDRVVLLLDLQQVVQRAATMAPAASPPAAERAAQRARILLAEDSYPEREALTRLLTTHGYEVVAAPDGRSALHLAAADRFDLVSTDVTMPHLDGYELTRLLRAQERHRDVPILMLTARGEPADRLRGFEAGVDEYLTKPVEPDLFLRTIARHLAQAHREHRP